MLTPGDRVDHVAGRVATLNTLAQPKVIDSVSSAPVMSGGQHVADTNPAYLPPASCSEYAWQRLVQHATNKQFWWRQLDPMANFILHWQHRFHNHGDMFFSCVLFRAPSQQASPNALQLTHPQLREAVRRLRYSHPSVALRLASRRELGIDPVPLSAFLDKRVDLQMALVYDVVTSEDEVQSWLDEVTIVHDSSPNEDTSSGGDFDFRDFVRDATAESVPGRLCLKFHFWPGEGGASPSRLVLEQCHSVSDAVGTLLVLDLLLSAIASTYSDPSTAPCKWGEEVTRLEPALQDAIAHPSASWDISESDRKQAMKTNLERLHGKATRPSLIDRIGSKVVSATLRNNGKGKFLRTLNTPLVFLCRSIAESGNMLPLGLLPQNGKPYTGEYGHTAYLSESLTAAETGRLLSVLKSHGLTAAPFFEACGHMATMWAREQRGLTKSGKGHKQHDGNNRILGSFSNAVNKRGSLKPEYQRYLGICMSGIPTKIAAASASWSTEAYMSARASPTDPKDTLPSVGSKDVSTLFSIAKELSQQYSHGRNNPDWLRYEKALMLSTMESEYLFLRDEAQYPSMPWLSSVGRLEDVVRGSYRIDSAADPNEDAAILITQTLEAREFRLLGRVGIRQPILHIYSFRKETVLQISYANWYYDLDDSDGRKLHNKRKAANDDGRRQNILRLWLQVFKAMIEAVLRDPVRATM